jgi:predicted nuclease of predicted toxin-antitoxin system
MTERIRFHLDENVAPVIAAALRRYGADVTTTVEAGLRTAPDHAHMAFAKREQRIIITHDNDFLRLAAEDPSHPGIVYCHQVEHSLGDIIRGLHLIFQVLTPEEMQGHVEYL